MPVSRIGRRPILTSRVIPVPPQEKQGVPKGGILWSLKTGGSGRRMKACKTRSYCRPTCTGVLVPLERREIFPPSRGRCLHWAMNDVFTERRADGGIDFARYNAFPFRCNFSAQGKLSNYPPGFHDVSYNIYLNFITPAIWHYSKSIEHKSNECLKRAMIYSILIRNTLSA